jgi:hypothetical protein
MRRWPPFDQEAKQLQLLRKLNEIPGVELTDDAISKKPSVQLALFRNDESLKKLFEVLEWFVSEARTT